MGPSQVVSVPLTENERLHAPVRGGGVKGLVDKQEGLFPQGGHLSAFEYVDDALCLSVAQSAALVG